METMRNVLDNATRGQDFYLLLGDFLDAFYRADGTTKYAMLAEAPTAFAPHEHLAYAAATAHKLANDNGITPPAWVFDERCYNAQPFFGCRAKGNLRLLFLYQSPAEFKHRNLFVDANVLNRV